MEKAAIKIENLRKQYRLGTIGGGTLSADLQSWWARKRGKEDPNLKIGQAYSKTAESFWALDGINMEIGKGEAVGIIGSNGAGKSTLLKILSRVTAPTDGDIWINGRISSMLEVGTGFHGELTGRENIYMNGAILGMSKKEVTDKMDSIIDFSECGRFIDTPVKRYSSGMYVKLAFAVAAHLDAEILVMDEVLAVGDMKFQKKCLGKMGDAANQEGKTVLYVSHNMNTIRQLCSRCIVLDCGKVIYDGDVEDAIDIYMGNERKELKTYYDFSQSRRPTLDHGSQVFLSSLEFVENNTAVYTEDKKIRIRVRWLSHVNVLNMRLYFIIISAEDDSVAGMTQSQVIGAAVEGAAGECCLEYDAINLAEGAYYFYPDLYIVNEYGIHHSYDHPLDKVYFEIGGSNQNYNMIWQRHFYGNVRLNEMIVI